MDDNGTNDDGADDESVDNDGMDDKKPQKTNFFTKLLIERVFLTNMGALSSNLAIRMMWHNYLSCHLSALDPD